MNEEEKKIKMDKVVWRQVVSKTTEKLKDLPNNAQNIHTPFDLCTEIIEKLKENVEGGLNGLNYLVFNLEFVEVLLYDYSISKDKIWFITDCKEKAAVCKSSRYNGINVILNDFLSWESNMKFDVIVGNYPYQSKSNEENTKTQAIWNKFVNKSFTICKDNGYISAIHPSGWRSCGKAFESAKILKEKQIEYLEIHSEQDGLKTFGATTRYDWYVVKNCPIYRYTTITDQDGKKSKISLKNVPFIPNVMIEKVYSMLAKNNEEKVEIICDSSYHTQRKDRMSETKYDNFIHPIAYSTPVEKPTIWYSSTKDNGHFGVSKIILNPCRPIGFIIDDNGKYGMSQFCVGIVGDTKYLSIVADVIKNQKTNGFAEFMESCHFTDKIFNKDVISLFRKNFWKEFV